MVKNILTWSFIERVTINEITLTLNKPFKEEILRQIIEPFETF